MSVSTILISLTTIRIGSLVDEPTACIWYNAEHSHSTPMTNVKKMTSVMNSAKSTRKLSKRIRKIIDTGSECQVVLQGVDTEPLRNMT